MSEGDGKRRGVILDGVLYEIRDQEELFSRLSRDISMVDVLETAHTETEAARLDVARLTDELGVYETHLANEKLNYFSARQEVALLRERIARADKVLADWCGTDELDACEAVIAARSALAGEEE